MRECFQTIRRVSVDANNLNEFMSFLQKLMLNCAREAEKSLGISKKMSYDEMRRCHLNWKLSNDESDLEAWKEEKKQISFSYLFCMK